MDYSNHTREQLIGILELNELSTASLLSEKERLRKLARTRLKRLNQCTQQLEQARAQVARLQREAHGG